MAEILEVWPILATPDCMSILKDVCPDLAAQTGYNGSREKLLRFYQEFPERRHEILIRIFISDALEFDLVNCNEPEPEFLSIAEKLGYEPLPADELDELDDE